MKNDVSQEKDKEGERDGGKSVSNLIFAFSHITTIDGDITLASNRYYKCTNIESSKNIFYKKLKPMKYVHR